jgi:hypothetical protein
MHKKRAGELRSRDAAPAVDPLQALKRIAASFRPRQVSARYTAPVRGTLREDLGVPYVGVVRASRQACAGIAVGRWASSGWDGTRCGRAPSALTAG